MAKRTKRGNPLNFNNPHTIIEGDVDVKYDNILLKYTQNYK